MKKILTILFLLILTFDVEAQNIDLRGEWIIRNSIRSFPEENFDSTFFEMKKISLIKNKDFYDTIVSILTLSEMGIFDYCVNTKIGKPDTIHGGKEMVINIVEGTCMNQYDFKNWHFDCASEILDLFFDNPNNDRIGFSDEEFDKFNIQRKKLSFRVKVINVNEIELILE